MEGWKVEGFAKFRDEKRTFESLGTKNELLWKFRDENDILPFYVLCIIKYINVV